MIKSQEIISGAQQQLVRVKEQLNSIEIVPYQNQVLHSGDFRDMDIFNKNCDFTNCKTPVLYTIELVDHSKKKELLAIFNEFTSINKSRIKGGRIYHSQDNTSNNTSNFLYVGCSMKDYLGRLKNHLGVRNSLGTYSLHLSKWDNNLDYHIRINTYQIIDTENNEIKNIVVEVLEQQIWDKLKPLFGKRSGLL
jgi:hypothetical protein